MSDTSAFLTSLGQRVRAARSRRGWTLRQLSEASGVSERYLSALEAGRGNISVGRLADVATALRTAPRDLLPDLEAGGRSGPVVSLLGLRGAGKSTVGAALAERLGVPFQELDALVEAEAGLTLAEVFEIHGEEYYRRLEYEALDAFLRQTDGAVLATGGGIVTVPEAYALLLRETTTVWLRAAPEDHWRRVVAQGDRRPMADNPHAMAELRTLFEQRNPLYTRARHQVSTGGLDLAGSVDAVLEALAAA